MSDRTEQQRREIQAMVLGRISDLIQTDPRAAAVALATASLPVLARSHPGPSVDGAHRAPPDTPAAPRDRGADWALSEEGTRVAVLLGRLLVHTALDHGPQAAVPHSHDEGVPVQARHRAAGAINRALEDALAEGISPQAVVSMTIQAAVARSAEFGLHPFQVVRPLNDGMGMALQRVRHPSAAEREESAVTDLARQMGISRSQARDHLRQSRSN